MVRPAAKRSGLGSEQEAFGALLVHFGRCRAENAMSSAGQDKDVTNKEIVNPTVFGPIWPHT